MKKIFLTVMVIALALCMGLSACTPQQTPGQGTQSPGEPATPSSPNSPSTANTPEVTDDDTVKVPVGPSSVKVAFITNLSVGGATEQGLCSRDGFQLAIDECNAGGGINGIMLEAVIYDDEASPEKAVEYVTRAIEQDGVVAITGFVNSGNAQASSYLAQEAGITMLVNYGTATDITTKYRDEDRNFIFRYSLLDGEQVIKMLDFVEKQNFSKIAILHDTSGYGVSGSEDLKKGLAARGLTYDMIDTLNTNDTDMTTQLNKFKNAGVDCVMTYCLSPENANILLSAKKIDYSPVLISSWSVGFTTFARLAGEAKNGSFYFTSAYSVGQTEKSTYLHETLIRKNGHDILPIASAFGYDAMNMLIQAMGEAGSFDSVAIRDALEGISVFDGCVGVIGKPFSKTDHEAISGDYIYLHIYENNVIVPAKY